MLLDLNYAGSTSQEPSASSGSSISPPSVRRRPISRVWIQRPTLICDDRLLTSISRSNIVANVLSSNYNAGTAKVNKRFSKGYSFLSTYTWSKNIDQGAEIFTTCSNHAFISNNLDFNDSSGVSVFDVPHRWVTSGIVDLPFGRGKQFRNSGGWQDKLLAVRASQGSPHCNPGCHSSYLLQRQAGPTPV